ncbi:MAG: SAV_2336 N-terminal domain-related protein, partial [Elainellaceae cyanobacterium]
APPEPADEPSVPLELPKPKVDQQSWGDDSETGTSIQIPTAFALRDRLQLARSLRPLRRKVASPGQSVLDEEETVTQTAELDILYPVIEPELERWLEVALVVEESQSTPIWRDTIDELQMLLGQGVFRDVRTWWIAAAKNGEANLFATQPSEAPQQRSRSPKELLDASKRRLIIVMSDCRSALWHQGKIHQWLAFWAQNGPVSVVQILPNQLWSQTALGKGYPVQLSNSVPGAASSRLDVLGDEHPWMLDEDEESDEDETDTNGDATNGASSQAYKSLQLPVVTLEPGPLKQWARVTAGAQEARTLGVYFDLSLLSELIRYEMERGAASGSDSMSPQELVKRFQTTASLTAQKLAGLIAAVPVSPPVVKIIQQEILPESRQVHVAEVFVSGLLRPAANGSALVEYEFLDDNGNDEVRSLLVDEVPIDETASVLDVISRYVAKRIGLEVRSFEALLSQQSDLSAAERDAVQPFARIAKQTLRRLGGEYKAIAERLDNPESTGRSRPIELDGDFPPLQSFTFRVATVT